VVAGTLGGLASISGTYDANGRLSTVMYPTQLTVKYDYTSLGYVQKLTDLTDGQVVVWTANARDAELHLLQDTAGNGIVTARSFDAPTGRLTSIVAGSGNGIVNFSYNYDALGNPLSRADGNTGVAETFTYDSLNRLTSSTVSLSPTPLVKNFTYDSIGNLLTKSDVGNYTYPAPGQARPHAVLSIVGDTVSATFTYDGNGNQINATGIGRNITYNVANKVATVTQGANSLTFYDDVDHQRYKQIVKTGATTTATTRYAEAFGARSEAIVYDSSGAWQWNDYLMVSGSMVGMRVIRSDGTTSVRYFHQDHLGSIAVITNETGALAEARDAYDAWGKRRNFNGTDDVAGILTSQTSRGFTGEEMLASVGLVHLNGRVYDPYIARMTSADPIIGDPLNGQTWNRYSYVWNNPLAYTDPTGYCPACIGTVNPQPPKPNGVMQFVESGFKIAVVAMCMAATEGACAPFLPLIAGATSAYFAGVHSGKLGVALKAGVIAYATAYAFQQIGIATDHNPGFDNPLFLPNVVGHALVGCASNAASGGKCGPGALSAGVTAFAGPIINGQGFSIGSLLMNTAVGGVASVAGGGKFANGAVTAAFGYLANNLGGSATDQNGATGGDRVYIPPAGTQAAMCVWCLVVAADLVVYTVGAISVELYDGLYGPPHALTEMAMFIHGALDDPMAEEKRTTAVLATAQKTTLAGGGNRDLDPDQRAAAQALGMVPVRLRGEHAEITVLKQAQSMGLTPTDLAVTRPICTECAAYIQSTGGRLTSPSTASWR
jgi:RHS repeat-associated protein